MTPHSFTLNVPSPQTAKPPLISYKKKASTATVTTPKLTSFGAAAPVKPPVGNGFDEVSLPATSVKLAQFKRVALLVCTTMERLPKKAPGPLRVVT